jgi:glucose-1-phosphate thymidylyltransferase
MDTFDTLPDSFDVAYIFIVGPHLGETQIPAYISKHYPKITAHYIVQTDMKGQSHAIYLTKDHLEGPMMMIFSDTLIETDFSFLDEEKADLIAWVKAVPDPRRFGVAVADEDGKISRLVEKPESMENNLVLVGCYYFKEGADLISAIDKQFERNVMLKNEYFLADAINIMLENDIKGRVEKVGAYWLDTGTIDATLETNAEMLGRFAPSTSSGQGVEGVEIITPVAIHPSAKISNSKIGPNVTIREDCEISDSQIEDSIIERETNIQNSVLKHSLIGMNAYIEGVGEKKNPASVNIGDNSFIK